MGFTIAIFSKNSICFSLWQYFRKTDYDFTVAIFSKKDYDIYYSNILEKTDYAFTIAIFSKNKITERYYVGTLPTGFHTDR